jgi:colicin import membrane protein
VTVAGATIFVWLAGCSVEAGGESAAHDLAEQFAKEARKSKDQARQRAEGDAEPARPTVEDRRKSEEAEMLARAQQEAEQRRAEMLKAREEAERADALRQAEVARAREEARRQADIARKAEEERRLAEAQRKEEEVKAAEARRQAEAARKAEEERWLAEARRKAEEEAKAEEARRQAEVARKSEEERQLAEARRRAEEQAKADEARRQAEAARVAEEERRRAEARRIAEEQARGEDERRRVEAAEQARRARLHAEREAEGERLADRLRQAREQRRWRIEEPASSTADIAPTRPEQGAAGLGGEPWQRADRADADTLSPFSSNRNVERVTVLLVIQPGNYGIRRHNKTGDPILCSESGCYVSSGADAAAEFLPGRRALKFGRIFGDRAGACSNSLGCVFRDIDLRSIGQFLAPVDMHVLKHDRRQVQHNVSVSDCRVEGARLSCRRGIRAADYVMWIVPEYVAEQAGPERLEQAVDDGLIDVERVGLAGSGLR